jgi:hypothetical protein
VIDDEIFLGTTGDTGEAGRRCSPELDRADPHDVLVTAVQVEQLRAPPPRIFSTIARPGRREPLDHSGRPAGRSSGSCSPPSTASLAGAEGPDAPDTITDIITRATVYKQ